MTTPLDRLRVRLEAVGAPLCLGVDPHPDALPDGHPRTVAGIESFARGLIEAAAEHVVAVKVNVAFFEAWGSAGWAALERVRADVPPTHLCVLDAKRGDIGSTAERYAEGLLGHLAADGVTVSPYLGEDAVAPFVAWPDRIVYVLARTSNPSAGRVQGLDAGGEPVHLRVGRWVAATWTDGRVGLVVGATAPADLELLRDEVPGPAFLVPGVGSQGGDLAAAVGTCHGAWAPGLVSVSRGIADVATTAGDWRANARRAAEALRGRMRSVMLDSEASAAQTARTGGS